MSNGYEERTFLTEGVYYILWKMYFILGLKIIFFSIKSVRCQNKISVLEITIIATIWHACVGVR